MAVTVLPRLLLVCDSLAKSAHSCMQALNVFSVPTAVPGTEVDSGVRKVAKMSRGDQEGRNTGKPSPLPSS